MVKRAIPLEVVCDGKKVVDILINESRHEYLFEKLGRVQKSAVTSLTPFGKVTAKPRIEGKGESEKLKSKPSTEHDGLPGTAMGGTDSKKGKGK